jgi:hypothetical protein
LPIPVERVLAKIRGGDLLEYILVNLWALIPIAAAFLIATIAINVISVPVSCADPKSKAVNWLLCRATPNPLSFLLDRETHDVYVQPGEAADPNAVAVVPSPRRLLAAKAFIDYLHDRRSGRHGNPGPDIVTGRELERLKRQFEDKRLDSSVALTSDCAGPKPADADLATARSAYCRAKARYDSDQRRLAAAWTTINDGLTSAAREAKARVLWAVSYGTLVAISLITAFAAFFFILQALRGHRRTAGHVVKVIESPGAKPLALSHSTVVNIGIFLAFMTSLAVAAAGIDYLAVIWFGTEHANAGSITLLSFAASHPTLFNDEIINWLTSKVERVNYLIEAGSRILGIAVLLICILVAASLYQTPGDRAFREGADHTEPANASYRRYLGRSFGRLKIAIYLGAALLVATMMELTTQFAWGLSLLPPPDDGPGRITQALANFAETISIEIGFAFTLFLAALYVPAMLILRERAREYYRARNEDCSLHDQEKVLASYGMSLRIGSSYKDVLAVAAPIATSIAAPMLGLLR